MIMYSIIPNEIIFAENEYMKEIKYFEGSFDGEKVQVMALSNNRYVVNRILSTSPKAYLNPKLQPGSIIEGEAASRLKI
jgi:hypothetical protein